MTGAVNKNKYHRHPLHVREGRTLTMGRCAKRILNTKELSEGAFHRVAARSIHSGYTGKKQSDKPLGD